MSSPAAVVQQRFAMDNRNGTQVQLEQSYAKGRNEARLSLLGEVCRAASLGNAWLMHALARKHRVGSWQGGAVGVQWLAMLSWHEVHWLTMKDHTLLWAM